MKYQKYKKEFNYSYAIGVYPTLQLLKYRLHDVESIYIHDKGKVNSGVSKIIQIANENKISIFFDNKVIEKFSDKDNTYAIAFFRKYDAPILDNNHLVLVNPSNNGNLGTNIRSMIAFGISDLVIIKPAVDIFNPSVVLASMGEIFQLRFCYFESFEDYYKQFQKRQYLMSVIRGGFNLTKFKKEKYSIVIGNEGAGLESEIVKLGIPVSIEQANNVDSLNVSVATGIFLYELSKNDSK